MKWQKGIKIGIMSLIFSPVGANVVGTDAQNFNPITNGIDFVTVHSSKTLESGYFNLGLFLNYAGNSLPFYNNLDSAGTPQELTSANDTILTGDLNMGLGLTKGWDVGVNFPYLLRQAIDDCSACGRYEQTGFIEWKINTKVGLLRGENYGLALIGSVNFFRIKNYPFTGKDPGPTYNIELAGDTRVRDVNFGLNLGYRLRNPGTDLYFGEDGTEDLSSEFGTTLADDLYLHRVPNQFIYSAAASYLLTSLDTKIIWEFFGSIYAGEFEHPIVSDREKSEIALETLLGFKHDINTHLALHGGVGTDIIHGIGTPDWRVYVGLNWTQGRLWGQEEEESKPLEVIDMKKEDKVTPVEVTEDVPYTEEYEEQIPEVQKVVLSNLRFKFNKTELQDYSQDDIVKLKELISNTPQIKKIIIEGHTDSIGSEEYNQKLSEGRAKAIVDIIVRDLRMDREIFEYHGYGESMPIDDNGNHQGREKNRRVEVKIYREVMKSQKRSKILTKKVKKKILKKQQNQTDAQKAQED